ncbi:MAG TPA: CsbD family protein [Albitalea sp.]|nr:CsbD family protein [Albitalea sp.]
MNKDQMKGRLEQAKGKAKQEAGTLSGNTRLESEGQVDKTAGKAQAKVGDTKQKVKRAIDKA